MLHSQVKKNGLSPFQNLCCYLGGSAIQTVGDNPVTAYRQLVQQFAKSSTGEPVNPEVAKQEARAVFKKAPMAASCSGLWPRLIGVGFKRVPKFGILLGYTAVSGNSGDPGFAAATVSCIIAFLMIYLDSPPPEDSFNSISRIPHPNA